MKSFFILSGVSVSAGWVCSLLLFPSGLSDPHGYNQLVWTIAFSSAHILVGLMLAMAAIFGKVSYRFAFSVGMSPIAHLLGSSQQAPWDYLLLFGPSLLVFAFGILDALNGAVRRKPRFSS